MSGEVVLQRPRVFVGSSGEGLEVARAIQHQLQSDALVILWTEGVFRLGQGSLEALVDALDNFDFAVIVFTPDDVVKSRGLETQAPRDNVMFELGLFMGRLGRSRVFAVSVESPNLKVPTDLAGVTRARIDHHDASVHMTSAVGSACYEIRNQIRTLGALKENLLRGMVRAYKDRTELPSFGEAILGCETFDILCFSANVVLSNKDQFREIVKNGARVRIILYDPGPRTDLFYSTLASIFEDDAEVKRRESGLLLEEVKFCSQKKDAGEYAGNIEVRWLSGTLLLYNMWIRDRGLPSAVGNLSVYFYRGRQATPVFRPDKVAMELIDAMGEEFEFVWRRAMTLPSGDNNAVTDDRDA